MNIATTDVTMRSESIGQKILRRFVDTRELTLLVLILLIKIVMSNLSPYFFSLANFRAVSVGMTPFAIIVIGMSILLASGGFDLSVGSVMALPHHDRSAHRLKIEVLCDNYLHLLFPDPIRA